MGSREQSRGEGMVVVVCVCSRIQLPEGLPKDRGASSPVLAGKEKQEKEVCQASR